LVREANLQAVPAEFAGNGVELEDAEPE